MNWLRCKQDYTMGGGSYWASNACTFLLLPTHFWQASAAHGLHPIFLLIDDVFIFHRTCHSSHLLVTLNWFHQTREKSNKVKSRKNKVKNHEEPVCCFSITQMLPFYLDIVIIGKIEIVVAWWRSSDCFSVNVLSLAHSNLFCFVDIILLKLQRHIFIKCKHIFCNYLSIDSSILESIRI